MFALENDTELDIYGIIDNEHIVMYYQPIISIKKKSMVGVEALCRGLCNGKIVSPGILFGYAQEAGLTIQLDRLCRKKAIEGFAEIVKYREDAVLFLNFDASIVDEGGIGSGNLLNLVQRYDINPSNVAIEVNEARVNDTAALEQFVETYRAQGFIIALDDVGAGHSNLNRIAIVKPDIIKADMMLLSGIHNEFYKQEVLKALVNLSRNVGALVVAEGVEKEEEVVMALEFGVDMFQGYYFAMPCPAERLDFEQLDAKERYIACRFKDYVLQKATREKSRRLEFETITRKFVYEMSRVTSDKFDIKLFELIFGYSTIECMYILDNSGIQVSETICNFCNFTGRRRAVFYPAPKGTDHSLKNYYYLIVGTGIDIYITEPYISLASGSLCVTTSMFFKGACQKDYILCIDAVLE